MKEYDTIANVQSAYLQTFMDKVIKSVELAEEGGAPKEDQMMGGIIAALALVGAEVHVAARLLVQVTDLLSEDLTDIIVDPNFGTDYDFN